MGFASDQNVFYDKIRWLMRSIENLVPIPRQSGLTFLDHDDPSNRMTVPKWKTFSGWCGHQHVPGETHYDPGAINIGQLL